MKNRHWWVTTTGLMFFSISPILAQPPRAQNLFPPEAQPSMLLSQKSVQEELKLCDDQLKKLAEIIKKRQEAREKMTDVDPKDRLPTMKKLILETSKQVRAILKPEQDKRLLQISWQLQGGQALATPPLAKELNLTDEQQKKVRELQNAMDKELDKIYAGDAASRDDARKKSEELTKTTRTKMLDVLTEPQRERWQELLGTPFKGELRREPNPGRCREP